MIKFKFAVITLIIFGLYSCKNETKQQKVNSNTITLNVENSMDDFQKEGNSTISDLIVKDCNQTFEEFFEHLSRDSTFQKSRVKYPLKESYIEGLESTKVKIDTINNASEYNYIDFTEDKHSMDRKYGKYKIEIEHINSNTIDYKHAGYDNGIYLTYKFRIIDGCWYMVEILDKST